MFSFVRNSWLTFWCWALCGRQNRPRHEWWVGKKCIRQFLSHNPCLHKMVSSSIRKRDLAAKGEKPWKMRPCWPDRQFLADKEFMLIFILRYLGSCFLGRTVQLKCQFLLLSFVFLEIVASLMLIRYHSLYSSCKQWTESRLCIFFERPFVTKGQNKWAGIVRSKTDRVHQMNWANCKNTLGPIFGPSVQWKVHLSFLTFLVHFFTKLFKLSSRRCSWSGQHGFQSLSKDTHPLESFKKVSW